MELRILYATAVRPGTTWYGQYGYGFGRGALGISRQQVTRRHRRPACASLLSSHFSQSWCLGLLWSQPHADRGRAACLFPYMGVHSLTCLCIYLLPPPPPLPLPLPIPRRLPLPRLAAVAPCRGGDIRRVPGLAGQGLLGAGRGGAGGAAPLPGGCGEEAGRVEEAGRDVEAGRTSWAGTTHIWVLLFGSNRALWWSAQPPSACVARY